MSAITLADLVEVSRQAISQFESGTATPHPDTLKRIASALNLPESYFYRPLRDAPRHPLYYRSLASTTKTARARSASRFDWLRDIVEWVREYVELPPVNLPVIDAPSDPALLTDDRIEELAVETRRYWGLKDGPISNVVRLLEKNGVIVARGAVDPDIDAFSTWDDNGRPYVFLGVEKGSAARSRLDAAHELGHLIIHRNVPGPLANRPEVHKLMEHQAKRFGSAFLMPEETFLRDVHSPTMDVFRALKPKWLVSISAMVYRTHQLGAISDEQVNRLWRTRSRLGWNRREPLDDQLPIEQPCLLRRSVELILDEGLATKPGIIAHLGLSQADIEELAGLPPRFLDNVEGWGNNVIPLRPRR